MLITKHGDIGTPELLKRKGLKIKLIEGQPRAFVINVSPIHTMYERDILNNSQYSAGKKFNECYIIGWGEKNSYEIRERIDGGSKEIEMTTRQVHAIKEYNRGIKAAGKEKDLVIKVCIFETPLTKRGMGGEERRRAIYKFRRALDRMAECYGFGKR